MKIGVIIIFRNNESSINVDDLKKQIKSTDAMRFCFVDNNSKDNTVQLLNEVKEDSEEKIEIVEIKKVVTEPMAKRAGARYLFNNYNLKYTGFINLESLKGEGASLNAILEHIAQDESFIEEVKTKMDNGNAKQSFFKGIFSIVDSIKEFNTNYKSLRLSI